VSIVVIQVPKEGDPGSTGGPGGPGGAGKSFLSELQRLDVDRCMTLRSHCGPVSHVGIGVCVLVCISVY
jgi:hypothetical protein